MRDYSTRTGPEVKFPRTDLSWTAPTDGNHLECFGRVSWRKTDIALDKYAEHGKLAHLCATDDDLADVDTVGGQKLCVFLCTRGAARRSTQELDVL